MSTKELRPKRNSILIGIAAVILLAIAGLSYRQWSQYALANADAAQTRDIIQSVDRLLLSLVDAETGQRGFLLTGEDRYLEPYNRSIQAIPTELSQLSKLLASRPNESGNLSRLDRLIDEKLSELQQTISIRQTQGDAPARNIVLSDEGKRRMDEIRSVSSAILTSQNLLENRASLDREGVARITLLATIAGGLILLFFFVFGFDPIVLRDPQVKGQQWPGTYGAAVVSTGMAVLLRLSLTPLIGSTAVPFITFFPAVLFSAWYGGFRVGMFSIVLHGHRRLFLRFAKAFVSGTDFR